jgi:hypothetical protein
MIDGDFSYPTNRADWIKTVLIGGVLSFFGILLIPLFVVYGYVIRVVRATIDGEDEPPVFEEWGDLLVEGLKAWLIGVVYMLVPLIVGLVLIGGSIAAMTAGGRAGAGAGAAGFLGGFLVTTVLALVFGYAAAAAIVTFAREERFGAAFDVGAVRSLVTDADFAVSWIVSLVGFLLAGAVTGIPFIGWLLGPFASFYALVVAGRLWGGGYLEATDGTTDAATTNASADEARSV